MYREHVAYPRLLTSATLTFTSLQPNILVKETTHAIYQPLLKVGVTLTSSQDVKPEDLGGRWSEVFADWVSSAIFTFLLRPALSHHLSQMGQSKRFLPSRATQ